MLSINGYLDPGIYIERNENSAQISIKTMMTSTFLSALTLPDHPLPLRHQATKMAERSGRSCTGTLTAFFVKPRSFQLEVLVLLLLLLLLKRRRVIRLMLSMLLSSLVMCIGTFGSTYDIFALTLLGGRSITKRM